MGSRMRAGLVSTAGVFVWLFVGPNVTSYFGAMNYYESENEMYGPEQVACVASGGAERGDRGVWVESLLFGERLAAKQWLRRTKIDEERKYLVDAN